MISKIFLRAEHWDVMYADILERIAEEACGIVAGVNETSSAVFPVTNVFHSPVRFLMAPEEQLEVLNQIEGKGWQLLAIYHSHLRGPEYPSPIDIAEAFYPEAVNLIWSNLSGIWDCRGFLIEKGQVNQISVVRLGTD